VQVVDHQMGVQRAARHHVGMVRRQVGASVGQRRTILGRPNERLRMAGPAMPAVSAFHPETILRDAAKDVAYIVQPEQRPRV